MPAKKRASGRVRSSAPVKKTRQGSGRSSPRPRPSPAVGGAQIRDLVEDMQAELEEASQHAIAHHEFAGFSAPPARMIGSAQLTTGSIGWRQELRMQDPLRPETATGGPVTVGHVYLVLQPRGGSDEGEGPVSPLTDVPWERFVYAEQFNRFPRGLLAATSEGEVHAPLLRRFCELLRADFDEEGT